MKFNAFICCVCCISNNTVQYDSMGYSYLELLLQRLFILGYEDVHFIMSECMRN